MWEIRYNGELQHHGVKGQKWGVRRYQNSDGSLTPAGKKRYDREQNRSLRKQDRIRKKEMRKAVRNRRLLSDEELDQKIKRIEKEKRLRELTDEEINRGRKITSEVLTQSGKSVATTLTKGAALYGVKYAMTKEFDIKDAASYVAPKPKNK